LTQKIAVAIVHGVGSQKKEFAKQLASDLKTRFAHDVGAGVASPEDEIQIRGVYWAEVLAPAETELEARTDPHGDLKWGELRNIMIDLGGDALAYQVGEQGGQSVYNLIHRTFAGTLKRLAEDAGPTAPLCVIAHSLGTVIAANYVWDLQHPELISQEVKDAMGPTPLDGGETVALLYTMGSPIAVWSLRFPDFGSPITFPAPKLGEHYPNAPAEWVNMYDRHDVIGYPLRGLNDKYRDAVSIDLPVKVGNWFVEWTPASHTMYWGDADVVHRLTQGLVSLWHAVNPA
jgi:hypothetical protein